MSLPSQPAAAAHRVADEPVECPLCDYDLRGLIDPRCPECGYSFDWLDLRDPARRKHKYLFEHHPERNVRSFVQTMLGHLRPRKFWGGLLPSQPSRPGRLLVYALAIALSLLLPPAALTVQLVVGYWSAMNVQRAGFIAAVTANPRSFGRAMPGATVQQLADRFAPAPSAIRCIGYLRGNRELNRAIAVHAVVLLWPVLSLAALMIFQISMRRARVRPSHFARCVVYSADVITWANLLLTLLVVGVLVRRVLVGAARQLPVDVETYGIAAACASAAALLVFVYRLIVALKTYVRFDHPVATILASQLIVLLLMALLVTVSTQF